MKTRVQTGILLACAMALLIFGCSSPRPGTAGPDMGSEQQMRLIGEAQHTGDYSLCEQAGDYRSRCIAETELQSQLVVRYDCCDPKDCRAPSCTSYTDCGGDGGEGCAAAHFCTVNETWLCETTGGEPSGAIAEETHGFWPPGFCICQGGKRYVSRFGCADCGSFVHEETRKYCSADNQHQYFRSVC